MKLLYGKSVAEKILSRLKRDISKRAAKPGLAVILVGNDKASHLYVSLKEKTAAEIGINFFRHDLLEDVSEDELISIINDLNADKKVHGIIVQLPLPEKFDTEKIISAINPTKDADGFHIKNTQIFLEGKEGVWPVFPRAIMRLIESAEKDLSEKKALVISNSHEFGSIMCASLKKYGLISKYILAGEMSSHLGEIKDADVLVSAVGSPGLLRGEMIKEGAIVIDGGIKKLAERVLGDVDLGSIREKNGYITPVPGGVGPVTIACLLENVYQAFEAQQKEEKN